MTSMPASRKARAMILAPRSCPSSPGLATTTRKGLFIRLPASVMSVDERSAILAEHSAKHIAHLAHRRLSLDGPYYRGHDILPSDRGLFDLLQRAADLRLRTRFSDALRPLDLTLPQTRVQYKGFEGQCRHRLHLHVHPDDELLLCFQSMLVRGRRIGNLPLNEPILDRANHAAAVENLPDQRLGLLLQAVGERFDVVGAAQRIDNVGEPVFEREDL